jgi:hypothetical protein
MEQMNRIREPDGKKHGEKDLEPLNKSFFWSHIAFPLCGLSKLKRARVASRFSPLCAGCTGQRG